jgi:hypothetical protein
MITWFVDHSSFLGVHMFFTKLVHLHKYFKLLPIFIPIVHKLTFFFEECLIKYNSNNNTIKKNLHNLNNFVVFLLIKIYNAITLHYHKFWVL